MPLLQHIAGRAYYIPGSNNLGVVATGDGGAVAIDTGLDKDTGRLVRKAHLSYLEAQGPGAGGAGRRGDDLAW